MNNTTNWPATVRELANEALSKGFLPSDYFAQLEDSLGPCPLPPSGYRLAKGTEDLWIGEDIVNRGYIITPAWNSTTNTHSIELWAANHEPPRYSSMSPAEALQLAADLLAVANAINSLA